MGGVVTEEIAISRDQYLELSYSQFGTLYDLIHNAPRPSTDDAKLPLETPIYVVIGIIQPSSTAKPAKPQSASIATSSTPTFLAKVNVI